MKKEMAVRAAIEAAQKAYAPYSHFHVGAALVTHDGKIYTGCNIENSSFGATNCAERTAFYKAVSEGEREFSYIVIAGGLNGNIEKECPPCGICRQVMSEFCSPDAFKVILAVSEENYKEFSLEELLPYQFHSGQLL